MYNRILYPTDGSDETGDQLDTVRELAETHDATVHILHVVDAKHPALGIGRDPNRTKSSGMVGDPPGADTPMVGDREPFDAVRQRAERYGERLVGEAARRLERSKTRTAVRSGDPAQVIAGYAGRNDIDIVVMSTHGRTGFARYLFPSTTETVVRLTDVPVLIVHDRDGYAIDIDRTAV